jgi:predicted nucleic acid-binding protein
LEFRDIVPVDQATFEPTAEQFEADDPDISFVNHTSGVLADERAIGHVLAFDSDLRTLGFTVVPADVGLPAV